MILRQNNAAMLLLIALGSACGAPVTQFTSADATAKDAAADAGGDAGGDATAESDKGQSADVAPAQDTIANDSSAVDAPDVAAEDTGPVCTVVTFPTVQGIINSHCTPCHTWAASCTVAKNSVQQVLGATGFMPPGGQNKMSEDEKAVLQQWIDDGKLCSSPGCP